MLTVIAAFLAAAALLLLVPATVFLAQVLLAGAPPPPRRTGAVRPGLAVLVPAHDEAAGIAATLRALSPQLAPDDRLLVVADNCSDDTAAVAAACGAEVTVRADATRRGKGYALDHGVRHLALSPRDLVVVVDADCVVADGALDALARACAVSKRPTQALYLMRAPRGAGLGQRMSQFAWAVRNQVRPAGWHRLGWPCQLMGTGMAFPWPLISAASLASGSIVEDMQLGIDLAAAGAPPEFCPQAMVTSTFPDTSRGALTQRTRWEHGHLAMIATRALPLLGRGVARGSTALVAMALDLSVPPLAVLVLLLSMLSVGAALLALAGGSVVPLAIALLALAVTGLATGLAWHRVGRSIVSFAELLCAPTYALAKIPIYVRLFTSRQRQWIRTKRDGDR